MPQHPATDVLRAGSPERLHHALVSTLAQNEQEWLRDFRDLMMALAPFHDCAERLGLDPATAFRDAANEGPASLRKVVAEFGARTDVSPSAFGFVVADTAAGPAYHSV
jgi:hypothetical protein